MSRGERVLIRVHRLSSLCAGRARFFALTPSPSPTLWERGAARGHVWSAEALASAWAEASLPHSIIPLSRKAGEGDKGVRAKRRACPFTPARRKSPPPQRFCTEPMYPYQPRGRGRNRDSLPARGEGSDKGTALGFAAWGTDALFRPHPQPLAHSVGEGSRALTCLEC